MALFRANRKSKTHPHPFSPKAEVFIQWCHLLPLMAVAAAPVPVMLQSGTKRLGFTLKRGLSFGWLLNPLLCIISLYMLSTGAATIWFTGTVGGLTVQIGLYWIKFRQFHSATSRHSFEITGWAHAIPEGYGGEWSQKGHGIVRDFQVQIQGHTLTFPAYVLPVAGTDVVIGASCLATMGPHVADYSTSTVQLDLGSQFLTLKGTRDPPTVQAQSHHWIRLQHTDAIANCFIFQATLSNDSSMTSFQLPSDLPLDLVSPFKSFFEPPRFLPPSRGHEHRNCSPSAHINRLCFLGEPIENSTRVSTFDSTRWKSKSSWLALEHTAIVLRYRSPHWKRSLYVR